MFGRERRVLLKDYLDQGLSKTAIAERLGISRRTVFIGSPPASSSGIWTPRSGIDHGHRSRPSSIPTNRSLRRGSRSFPS